MNIRTKVKIIAAIAAASLFVTLFIGGIIYAAYSAMPDRVPLAEKHMPFVGKWLAETGSTITIYEDSVGDFKTSGSSMTGGQVKFAGNVLSIGAFGFEKKFFINEPPHEVKGGMEMKLNSVKYRKLNWAELEAAPKKSF